MIPVTKTFLPPIEEYQKIIKVIWENNWITNRGNLVNELEEQIKSKLGIWGVIATANGTLPIQIALKLLARNGEVITTPFSYVATTAAIVWENCTPVFVDIHPEYLTIDETKIEAAITDKTTAILATHVYGNPCNVLEIEKIAAKHNLKVIYDAAHSFGVNYNGQSIFNYGDISTCSFHATKIFHSGEGGAMFCKDFSLGLKMFYSHNFGHSGEENFAGLGINAKMNELQAAMGLCVLPYLNQFIEKRKKLVTAYKEHLLFDHLRNLKIREATEWNYSYFPVIFDTEEDLLRVKAQLNKKEIFPRRYFYPSLDSLSYVDSQAMEISRSISRRILCLPLFESLKVEDVKKISKLINQALKI